MNFRTLIMLAVAALVIVVAVNMNRNSVAEPEVIPPHTAAPDAETNGFAPESGGMMTEEEAQKLIYDDMDGTVDAQEDPDAPVTEDLDPAVPQESPADALESGPAEDISDEPVTPSDEKPATE